MTAFQFKRQIDNRIDKNNIKDFNKKVYLLGI